jgi:hypothetical protein
MTTYKSIFAQSAPLYLIFGLYFHLPRWGEKAFSITTSIGGEITSIWVYNE